VGQVARRVVGAVDQVDLFQPHRGLFDRGMFGTPIGRQTENAEKRKARCNHQGVVLGDQQIFQDRHAAEQPDILEGARDAGFLRDEVVRHTLEQEQAAIGVNARTQAGRRQRVDLAPQCGVAVAQRDAPLAWLVEAGNTVEYRGFAGAVRPDQRGDVALLGAERQIVHGDKAAEAHGEMLDPQDRVGRHPRPSLTNVAATVLRSFKNALGSRVEIRPRGFQIMIITIARPNSSMRYCVGSKSLPKICLRKSRSRMISVPPIMATAATATPIMLPMPPSTTMATIIADSMKVKDSGEMKPWRAAKKEPANPPNIAPMAKAVSFVLVVFTPSERQAISSSRSASQARPTGSLRKRSVTKAVSNESPTIT